MSRIVVTGLGAISGLGHSVDETWAAARDGVCAIRPHLFDPGAEGPGVRTTLTALVEGDLVKTVEAALGARFGQTLDPFALLALKAAHEAVEQAGLLGALESAGAVLGHGFAGIHTLEAGFQRFYGKKADKLHPLTVPKVMVSAPASAVAIHFGVRGPVFSVSSACASSGHAIAQAAGLIASGQAEVVLAGGSEAIATPGCLRAWEGLMAMSPNACRPFSAGRDGMAIGEGAACLVLESLDHAEARGATILAELSGAGASSDAFHWTQPSLEGAITAVRGALRKAEPDARILVSAHGTGTPLNDANEAAALNAVFGPRGGGHPVVATKSAHGHLIGAATALQAVIGLKALAEGLAPPILNWTGPDPDIDLNLITGEARSIDADHLLVNAFAFGGLNAALLFRKW